MGRTYQSSMHTRTNTKYKKWRKDDRRRLRRKNRNVCDEMDMTKKIRKPYYNNLHGFNSSPNCSSVANVTHAQTTFEMYLQDVCRQYNISYVKKMDIKDKLEHIIYALSELVSGPATPHLSNQICNLRHLKACHKQLVRRGAFTPFRGHDRSHKIVPTCATNGGGNGECTLPLPAPQERPSCPVIPPAPIENGGDDHHQATCDVAWSDASSPQTFVPIRDQLQEIDVVEDEDIEYAETQKQMTETSLSYCTIM